MVDYWGSEVPLISTLHGNLLGLSPEEKHRLERRLAVLERIVTDRGIETAEQIEALRHLDTEEMRG